jgi:hypothetical protein
LKQDYQPKLDKQLQEYYALIDEDITRQDCIIRRNMPNELQGIPENMVDIIKLYGKESRKYR